jgi:predicted transposase YdaD
MWCSGSVIRELAERLEREATGDPKCGSRAPNASLADRLLVAAYVLTGLRLKSPDEVRQLFQVASIAMRESVTYQAILEEGREEGRVEELHRTIQRLGRRRFGEPDEAIRERIEAIRDIVVLEDLTERLLIVSSWHELMA